MGNWREKAKTQALLMLRNTAVNYRPLNAGATAYGSLCYDIHAMFAAHRCASAGVDSRDLMAASVLIAGHAGTAAAVCGSALGISPAARPAVPRGTRASKLDTGADAELGEDFRRW